jgi:hypothetical protein
MALMDRTDLADFNHLPLATRHALDRICTAFEVEWQAGRRPSLETHLERLDGAARCVLLRELLRLDVDYRKQRGETPAASDYLPRFSEHSEVLAAVIASDSTLVRGQPWLNLWADVRVLLARASVP